MHRCKMARKSTNPKRASKAPSCPECGSSNVVPVIHGPMTPSLQSSINKGQAVVANREEWEGMTEWYCKDCGCDWSGEWRRFKKSPKI